MPYLFYPIWPEFAEDTVSVTMSKEKDYLPGSRYGKNQISSCR
jgi:hypothetical protein